MKARRNSNISKRRGKEGAGSKIFYTGRGGKDRERHTYRRERERKMITVENSTRGLAEKIGRGEERASRKQRNRRGDTSSD